MSLRDERTEKQEAIMEGRYITHVLKQNANELDQDIDYRVQGFRSSFYADRNFTVKENVLTYTHARGIRFSDMKSRNTLRGKRRKKHYAIHNRPIYGHANEIIKDLHVGYTSAAWAEMMKLDNTKI